MSKKKTTVDYPINVTTTVLSAMVTLYSGKQLFNSLDMHLWLKNATAEQLAHVEYFFWSIWWPDLDEGLDIEGMRRGFASNRIESE